MASDASNTGKEKEAGNHLKREVYDVFLEYHSTNQKYNMFHSVAKTGVIYATSRAKEYGFSHEDEEWANMGQGAPETGLLQGSPARSYTLHIPDEEVEYAPTAGESNLRIAIARYYNHLYRKGMASQYTEKNVCVVPGGRAGITRIMASLGNTQVGYFIPDYTAYEQALGLFLRVNASPLVHRDMNESCMPAEEFEFQLRGRGLGAVLMSNPANPTGQSIEGEELKKYVDAAKRNETCLIMDEFYSHYYYDGEGVDPVDGGPDDDSNWPKTVSSSKYIEDVDIDPILIVNGLTKNWRCPGFRVCWIIGPSHIVDKLSSAGSFLDGGANAPLQQLALPLMELDFIRKDAWALQRHFKKKRNFLLSALSKLGIKVKWIPTSTFYVWADLSELPPPINDCLVFLEECVRHKIVCVPGVFFDINPHGNRNIHLSPCISNVRFSYGPSQRNLENGVKHLETMINKWRVRQMRPQSYVNKCLLSSIEPQN